MTKADRKTEIKLKRIETLDWRKGKRERKDDKGGQKDRNEKWSEYKHWPGKKKKEREKMTKVDRKTEMKNGVNRNIGLAKRKKRQKR